MKWWLIVALIAAVLFAAHIASKRAHTLRLRRQLAQSFGGKADLSPLDADAIEDAAAYWQAKRQAAPGADAVDDTTWADLDMDAVFARLCAARSGVGEEALYAMLRETGAPAAVLARRREIIEFLQKNAGARDELRLFFAQMGRDRYHGACPYLFHPDIKRPQNAALYAAMAVAPTALVLLGLLHPLFLMAAVGAFLVNLVFYFKGQLTWRKEQVAIRHLAGVLVQGSRLAKLEIPELRGELDELRALQKELSPVLRWCRLFTMTRAGDMDFFTDYIKIMFQTEINSLISICAFLQRHPQAMRRFYELVGELDALCGVASARATLDGFCAPAFHEEGRVLARGLTHPLIAGAVPNDIDWQRNALITGSNASGKSTFTKALAINAILAQSVVTCTARAFALPRAQIITSMAVKDSVLNGESYFIAEIKSLRRILEALSVERWALLFIDEILRGTNTVERIAASTALLRFLAGRRALCMAATHDVELTALLRAQYANYHFREEITARGMEFPYKLMDGPADSRNAIALLKTMRFPPEVTAQADELCAYFDANRAWPGADGGGRGNYEPLLPQ